MFTLKMQTILNILVSIIVLMGLSACEIKNDETSSIQLGKNQMPMVVAKSNVNNKKSDQQMTITGQILYQAIEGGFFGFIANNGDKYTPRGLDNKYRQNGLIVELKAELIPDIVTTTQFGKVIKVLEIKVIDSSKVSEISKSM